MKNKWKVISLLCAICLLLSACSMLGLGKKGEKEDKVQTKELKTEKPEKKATEKEDTKKSEQQSDKVEKLGKKQSKKTIAPDSIRKISMDSIVNKGIYTGFTQSQEKMLETNGFVIMEPNFNEFCPLKMHQPYEALDYSNASMIITTDVVLHMWHVFYAESMKSMELKKYFPNLKEVSLEMERKAIEEYQSAPDALDGAYANIIAFFHVGNALLREGDVNWHTAELKEKVTEDALEIAKEELKLIQMESAGRSKIFGRDIDYSQFKVRGHYTTNPDLTKYFKAMMWYGLTGFDLKKQPVEAALIAEMITQDKNLMKLWQENYDLTTLYSGESDDILITQMQEVLGGFDDLASELANQKGVDKLEKAYQKLPSPRIVANLSEENAGFATDKVFKFMGQRFSVDAYIMQNLMEPFTRPLPTSFDVFTAMGSETAEKILRENYVTNQHWDKYDEVLEKMTEEYASGELSSADTFYNGWIRAIDHTLNYVPEGKEIPHFMASPAYEYKKINAALGSFAELKHDNILYSKQAVAEMGGPEENRTLHYLEPNEDLYQELLALSTHAEKMLQKLDVDMEYLKPLSSIKDMMKVFVEVSRKELNGENITEDELRELTYFGGLVEYLSTRYLYDSDAYDISTPKTTAVIADIATVLPANGEQGGYLEVATGLPYEMYALCHVNGVDFLAKGIVYSAFEFLDTDKRWTDEEWHKAIGIGESNEYGRPELNTDEYDNIRGIHMEYYKKFSTGEANQVEHSYNVEVKGWPKLIK